jgi:hypothetical protein
MITSGCLGTYLYEHDQIKAHAPVCFRNVFIILISRNNYENYN